MAKKIAMPVVRPSPQVEQQMANEGVRLLYDISRELPANKIKALRSMLSNMGGIDGILLPKVFFPSSRNIVQYEGKSYYYLHHDKNKDKLWLLDPATNQPLLLSYKNDFPKLKLEDEARRKSMAARFNKAVKSWNEKVETFDSKLGLVTVPLRVNRAVRFVDERLTELQGQKTSIEAQQKEPGFGLGGHEAWRAESVEALRNGSLMGKDQDAIDTVLYQYHDRLQQALQDLPSFQISPQAKKSLTTIIPAEIAGQAEKAGKEQDTFQAREERVEQGMPTELEPDVSPLQEIGPEHIPSGSPSKPNAYRSPEAYFKQKPQILQEIGFQITTLTQVKSALQNLIQTIGRMEKGQFSEDYLHSKPGLDDLNKLRGFLQESGKFIQKYQVPIFIEGGKVNPRLFGSSGTMGNAELAIEMNRIYSSVKRTLEKLSPVRQSILEPEPQPQPVSQTPEPALASVGKVVKTAGYKKIMGRIQRWSGVRGQAQVEEINMSDLIKWLGDSALAFQQDILRQLRTITPEQLAGSYLDITLDFESSGYRDPGVLSGPIEQSYPPEGDDERVVTGGTLDIVDQNGIGLGKVRVNRQFVRIFGNIFSEQVDTVEMDSSSFGDKGEDDAYDRMIDERGSTF